MRAVEKFYDSNPQAEWERLEKHPMEYNLTMRALREYLSPNSTVLDVGGGPGRYAIALTQMGHKVTLLDLSAANIALAKDKAAAAGVELEGYIHGDALDLSTFGQEAYDAVLLFGPLYHLTNPAERDTAIQQAMAKLKPGGILFAAFISRYAFLIDIMKHEPQALLTNPNTQDIIANGINWAARGFTDAWFTHPREIKPLLEGHGLTTLKLMSAEGIAAPGELAINKLPPEHFQAWADLCWQLSVDESLLGISEHLLYIGRKQ